MTVLAFLSDPTVLARILGHLALPSTPPLLADSRLPFVEESYKVEPLDTGPPDARDPP